MKTSIKPQVGIPDPFGRLVGKLRSWTPEQPLPAFSTIPWLRQQTLPATPFLFEGRVPYGIWTHWAPPGGYKSAMAAQFEHAIVYGYKIPGLSWTPNRRGTVLVIDPDGTVHEDQDRTFLIAPFGQLECDADPWDTPDRPQIITLHEPKGKNVAERIAWLWQQIGMWEAAGFEIPWIRWDTLASLLGSSEKNAYDHAASALRELNHRMASEHRVLFLPHHQAKDGTMIGSTAIHGCSNLVTKITRTKGAPTGTLEVDEKIRGAAPWELAVIFCNGVIGLTDMHPVQAKHKPTSTARQIADHLTKGPSQLADLYEAVDAPAAHVRVNLSRMQAGGQVMHDEDDRWRFWPAGTIGAEVNPAGPAPGPIEQRLQDHAEPEYSQETALEVVFERIALDTMEESVPELAGGNPAIEQMIDLLKESTLYPLRRLAPEIKSQLGYDRVALGGAPNSWMMFPDVPPEGDVVVLDRSAAFFQSAAGVWLVPNRLHREGDLDWQTIYRKNTAGMFQIIAPVWTGSRPNPLGMLRAGEKALIPRPTLDRLWDFVRAGDCPEPAILWGLVGKGTERLLRSWARWCMDQRRGLPQGFELDKIKDQQSGALQCLRKIDESAPGPVDRPDWSYAIQGHHYATANRNVCKALDLGEHVLGYGNTDEIVWLVPEGQDPAVWTPPSMAEQLAKRRYSVKGRRPAADWFANPNNRKPRGQR